MILQSLAKLAEREGLIENPDYQPGEVSWVIRLNPDGRFITLESLLMPPEGKKGKPRGQRGPIPRPFPGAKRQGTKPDAEFLVDNAAFVLGRDYSKEQRAGSREGELERRSSEFKRHVNAAAEAIGHPSLQSVLAFLTSADATESARGEADAKVESKDFLSNHLIAFHVEGDAGFVHSLPEIQSYWASVRKAVSMDAEGVQCLITGDIGVPIDKHPPIKRVPGNTGPGVAIVSYNSSAFESYGFQRNENAPVSRAAAEAYATALNRLLDPATLNPKEPGVRLPEQRVQVADDTVAVFWTDQISVVPAAIRPALDEEDDALAFFDVQLAKPTQTGMPKVGKYPRLPRMTHRQPQPCATKSNAHGRDNRPAPLKTTPNSAC
ncbi:MAG: type I-C CRISPR-associated protein Cas8c/Csd1 [Planctomycetota bacterium]|nr:type I-C CRISPR-associated protein Cas8c/Csd1 [Planctomycetota bacterium]